MPAVPPWVWVVLVIVAALIVAARLFYARFRGMCRGVRADLTKLLQSEHPGYSVLCEEAGNLVVNTPDGGEHTWEMADIYSEVAQLPGMGADPQARQAVYRHALREFIRSVEGPAEIPLEPSRVKPLVVPGATAAQLPAGAPHRPLPELGLEVIYVLDGGEERRQLTAEDAAALSLDAESLHREALENLRRDFPGEMVTTAVRDDSGSAIRLADGFDAARLLLIPERLKAGEAVVALAPHRDMLVLLPGSQAEDPARLQEGLAMLEGHDHGAPLLSRPVRVTSEGFTLL